MKNGASNTTTELGSWSSIVGKVKNEWLCYHGDFGDVATVRIRNCKSHWGVNEFKLEAYSPGSEKELVTNLGCFKAHNTDENW